MEGCCAGGAALSCVGTGISALCGVARLQLRYRTGWQAGPARWSGLRSTSSIGFSPCEKSSAAPRPLCADGALAGMSPLTGDWRTGRGHCALRPGTSVGSSFTQEPISYTRALGKGTPRFSPQGTDIRPALDSHTYETGAGISYKREFLERGPGNSASGPGINKRFNAPQVWPPFMIFAPSYRGSLENKTSGNARVWGAVQHWGPQTVYTIVCRRNRGSITQCFDEVEKKGGAPLNNNKPSVLWGSATTRGGTEHRSPREGIQLGV